MAEERRGHGGGIFGLLDLIEEHRGAVEYDWRTRFHLPASSIGHECGWGEALRLAQILRADPSSMIAAALEGWDHPISRESLILMDQFDLDVRVATGGKGNPKPHPMRPGKQDDRTRERKGNVAGRSRAEVIAILNAHGHNLPPV